MASPANPDVLEYDYIIVGGGTSGPVAARRIAEGSPNSQVLLIEAGPSNLDIINSRMAMGWQNIHFSEYDWDYDTQPQKHANDRVVHVPRGKFLGGSSGLNGTLMLRGTKVDYDNWANLGNVGWSWNDVLPLFKKSEKFIPTEGFPAELEYHGTDGPLLTTVHPLAPISEGILESYIDKGIEYKPDMFVTGEGAGAGHVTRTVHEGYRTSGADFVNNNPPSNLHVLYNTTVTRVVLEPLSSFDKSGKLSSTNQAYVATGVEASTLVPPTTNPDLSPPPAPQRTSKVLKARKEVILSAGAYNSPVLLMHSGIGPKEHIEEVGVPGGSKVDLPWVGSNMEDHMLVFNFYQLNSNLTYDHLLYPPGALDITVSEWLEKKTGILGRFPFGPFAYVRLDERLKDKPEWKEALAKDPNVDPMGQLPGQPHVEYWCSEAYGGGPQHKHLPSKAEDSVFAMLTMLMGPQSRGTVRLASADPFAKPLIDHNYLGHPLDLAVLAEGVKFAHEIVTEGKGTRDHVVGAWPEGRKFASNDDEWKQYVREQVGTTYHPSCTCKMGPDSDETAVVDPRLRVRGVKNLRVADISILPKLNNGHTQAPAYMIGEKAAILVLEDNKA